MYSSSGTLAVPNTETQPLMSDGHEVNGVYEVTIRATSAGVFVGSKDMPAGSVMGSGNHEGYELPSGKDIKINVFVSLVPGNLPDRSLYVTTTNPGATITYYASLRL